MTHRVTAGGSRSGTLTVSVGVSCVSVTHGLVGFSESEVSLNSVFSRELKSSDGDI